MAKDPSKTEKATPKRINKARSEGNVAKSNELAKVLRLLSGLIILNLWLTYVGKDIMGLFKYFLSSAPFIEINQASVSTLFFWLSGELAKMVLPILLFIGFCSYISMRIQVGKLWSPKALKFKFSRMNPLNGLKRMFMSMDTFIRLAKSLLQALFIGLAPWLVIKDQILFFPSLYELDAAGVAEYMLTIGSRVVKYGLIPMIAIAAFDLWHTRHQYNENLKMTKGEIKDEHKQQEGDLEQKQKMRQKMTQIVMANMMKDVPKADVVITNPTHIAVALRYDTGSGDTAPVVVAMGINKVAEKIKQLARENNVPVRENKPLARALYKLTEVGDAIPGELFQAVAVILAQIWKTRPKAGQA